MLKKNLPLFCVAAALAQMCFANSTSVDPTTTALTASPATTPAPEPVIALASTPLACNAQLAGKSVTLGSAIITGVGPQMTCTITLNIQNGKNLKSLLLTHNGNGGAARSSYYSCSSSSSGQSCGYRLGFRHARAWFKATYTGCGLNYPLTKFITAPDIFHGYAQSPYTIPVYLTPNCAENDSITIQLQHFLDEGDTGWGAPNYNGSPGFVQELSVFMAANAPQPASSSASTLGQASAAWLLLATIALAVL